MPAFVYILFSVLLNVFGQMSLKLGTRTLGNVNFTQLGIISEVMRVFSNPYILGGIFLYGVSTLFWISALSKADLSYAYPFLALGYVLIIVFSYFILRENITVYKLVGIFLIVLGLIVIAKK